MSFAETHRYAEATAKRRHSPGTPLSACAPRSSNSSPDPITRSRSVLDTSTSFGPASALTRDPMCTPIPPMSSPRTSHSPSLRKISPDQNATVFAATGHPPRQIALVEEGSVQAEAEHEPPRDARQPPSMTGAVCRAQLMPLRYEMPSWAIRTQSATSSTGRTSKRLYGANFAVAAMTSSTLSVSMIATPPSLST